VSRPIVIDLADTEITDADQRVLQTAYQDQRSGRDYHPRIYTDHTASASRLRSLGLLTPGEGGALRVTEAGVAAMKKHQKTRTPTAGKKKIEVVETSTGEVVHALDITGKGDKEVEKITRGMLINMDTDRFHTREVES
jgi:hypothetical protein